MLLILSVLWTYLQEWASKYSTEMELSASNPLPKQMGIFFVLSFLAIYGDLMVIYGHLLVIYGHSLVINGD